MEEIYKTDEKRRIYHFRILDSWRGVCACMVALLHFMAYSHIYDLPIIKNAGFFVDFFFVLSGFVIFANYEDRLKKGFGFLKFMFLRFGRLYPLHIAIFLAFVSVDLLQIWLPVLQNYAQFAPFSSPGEKLPDIVAHIFLLHALDTEEIKGFNGPSWSISAEFYTYAVFAAALIFLKDKIRIFNMGIFIMMPVILVLMFTEHRDFLFIEGFFRCLFGFSAGAICWQLWNKYHSKIDTANISRHAWSGLEILILISLYGTIALAVETPLKYFSTWLFGVAVLTFAFEKGIVSKILGSRFFVLLGILSYSIYMNHAFIAGKIFPFAMTLAENYTGLEIFTMVDGREKLGITKWHGDAISIVYLAILLGASLLTYYIIEKPFRDLSRNIVKSYKRRSQETVSTLPEAQ